MKKVIRIFCVLSLVTLALVGCSSSDEGDAKKVAKELTNSIYTVDAKEVVDLSRLILPSITEEGPKGEENYKKQSDALLEMVKAIDKNIVALMTEEGYEEALRTQFKTVSTKICVMNNYIAQVTDLTLGENVYKDYKDNDKVRYPYEVKFDFISSDGKTKQADTAKGTVDLVKRRW
ncbi:hypothetical protein [Clostridium sp. CF012]|uniref:hypothetical protein n=1 Tax=Clostridium sp. CF012 TaxID=2843319 RepID=UPI001C0B0FB9|nr:hypothetical protein [Clostridium sp. CF012]MBU3146873.1 hypothetical protein [Clostridium sp. CF012]